MSHLLYLSSFPWKGGPGRAPRPAGLRRKPLSEMGLGLPVLEAYAPRFKKSREGAWLTLLAEDQGPLVLGPERVALLARALEGVAALEAPKLRCSPADAEHFSQAFTDELVAPIVALVGKPVGLYAEWC